MHLSSNLRSTYAMMADTMCDPVYNLRITTIRCLALKRLRTHELNVWPTGMS